MVVAHNTTQIFDALHAQNKNWIEIKIEYRISVSYILRRNKNWQR